MCHFPDFPQGSASGAVGIVSHPDHAIATEQQFILSALFQHSLAESLTSLRAP